MSNQVDKSSSGLRLERVGKDRVNVSSCDTLLTTLNYGSWAKPVFFSVRNPAGIPMTRSWPLVDAVTGEEHDHPHQKSVWFAHEVNGVDFWHETTGRIVVDDVKINADCSRVSWSGDWLERVSGNRVCRDETVVTFALDDRAFSVLYEVSVIASDGPITFADTKEGTFAIRLHPHFRLKPKPEAGIDEVFGSHVNSEGLRGVEAWGKRAKWGLYWGKVEGKLSGVAIFDHPDNLRYPTTWHTRDYGLFAANPFGLHDFEGKPLGTGEHTLAKGQRLTQRYQAVFFTGQPSEQDVDAMWQTFVM